MKKSKMNKIWVVCFIIVISICSVYFITRDASANELDNNVPINDYVPTCTSAENEALANYYGLKQEVEPHLNEDGTIAYGILKIAPLRGEFKIKNVTSDGENGLQVYDLNTGNRLSLDNLIGMTMSGSGAVNDFYNNGIKLKVLSNYAQVINFDLVLSKSDNVCLSRADFDARVAALGENETASFGTYDANVEVTVPILTTTSIYDNSPENLAICNDFRSGAFATNELSPYKSLYNSSGEAKNFYNEFLSGACDARVHYVLEKEDLIDLMYAALRTWNFKSIANRGDSYAATAGSDWNFEFKYAKQQALLTGHAFYVDSMGTDARWFKYNGSFDSKSSVATALTDEAFSMKCKTTFEGSGANLLQHAIYNFSWNAETETATITYTEDPNDEIYNIHANNQYYYANNITNIDVKYIWYHTSGKATTETKTVCTRECEEVVEVSYGPPVSSKSGFCFEYQVQVSSKVECSIKSDTGNKPTLPSICTPVPICYNNGGAATQHQGGSNDEFDQCINSCDGGKYTSECSDMCYSKVYEKSTGFEDMNMLSYDTKGEKVAHYNWRNEWPGYEGKYIYESGEIVWDSPYWYNTYARYYQEREPGRTWNDHNGYWSNGKFKSYRAGYKGVKRANHGTYLCGDYCYFTGCNEYTYLNKPEAQRDLDANMDLYLEGLDKCSAAASCTTKTATFTINVSYVDKDDKRVTVNFPYTENRTESATEISNTSNPDKLQSSDNGQTTCAPNNQFDKNASNSNNHVVIAYDGCYKNCDDNASYHSRWTFPMIYFNNKDVEERIYLSHEDSNYTPIGRQFCIPEGIKDTNRKWWFYFNQHNDDIRSGDNCKLSTSEASSDPNDIDYNINAETEQFGHFGWNLKISCFFAVNNTFETEGCGPSENYRVRSVDLKKLFPSEDSTDASDSTSRTEGFNWSEFANSYGDGTNPVLPELYKSAVEKINYNVYSDNYLDYQVTLTKSDLKNIRKNYNMDANNKKVKEHNGIYSYESDLLRGSASKPPYVSNAKLPGLGVLGCNNITNYGANSCVNHTELLGLAGGVE